MKLLIIAIVLGLFYCCGNNEPNSKPQSKLKSSFIKEKKDLFVGIDSTKAGESISCARYLFKLINDKYVLRIYPKLPVQFDKTTSLDVDSSNQKWIAELHVFDNKNASLINICTDLLNPEAPVPSRKLLAESGKMIVGFSDPTQLYGNWTHKTTVQIKKLIFIDQKSGEKIEIKDELMWKVLDLGIAG